MTVLIVTPDFRYDGEFHNGKFHGRGTLTLSDGRVFSGKWHRGALQPTWGEWIGRWFYLRYVWRFLRMCAYITYDWCSHPVSAVLYLILIVVGSASVGIYSIASLAFRWSSGRLDFGDDARKIREWAWTVTMPLLLLAAYILNSLMELTFAMEAYAATLLRKALESIGLRAQQRRRPLRLCRLPALEYSGDPSPPKQRTRVVQPKSRKNRRPPKKNDPSPKRTRFEQEAEEARLEEARKRRERAEAERARRKNAPESTTAPGPSHRPSLRQRVEQVVASARHHYWVSEEGRQDRRAHGEDTKKKKHDERLAREAKAAKDAAREKVRQDGAWEALRSGEFAPPQPHMPPTEESLAALDDTGPSNAADDAASCFSMATSALPLRHTQHSELRGEERSLTLRQAKRAVKRGKVRPGNRPGTFVHEYRGVKAVTNTEADTLITHARRD